MTVPMPTSHSQRLPAQLPPTCTPTRLLLVEDEAIVAMDMAQQLEQAGYTVVGIADNGADAERLAHETSPDLVLMDVVIKGAMDGIQTAERLRETCETPAIFLTAFNDARTVQRAAAVGPYGYVTKPYQVKDLRAAIEVALAKSETEAQLRRNQEALTNQARLDALTGLPNRMGLAVTLDDRLAHGYRGGKGFALLFMDLDFFKQVNDEHGHAGGDQILRAAGHRMRRALRDADTVGRWGGDEFVALIDGVDSADSVAQVARKLQALFEHPIPLDGGASARIGLSIGISLYPSDGEDAQTLLQRADEALYRAKADGRGLMRFHAADIDARLRNHYVLAQELSWALDDMALQLHCRWDDTCQPGAPRAAHAELSWLDPAGRLWRETDLRALAVTTGLTDRLDEWVLVHACTEAASQPACNGSMPAVSVRLGRQTVRAGRLPALVEVALQASGLPPERLCVELPAGVLGTVDAALTQSLDLLRERGIRLAVHEVGQQPVSLPALRNLAPTALYLSPQLLPRASVQQQALDAVQLWCGVARLIDAVAVAPSDAPPDWHAALRSAGCWLAPVANATATPDTVHPAPLETPS